MIRGAEWSVQELKSGEHELKSRSDHQLDLSQVVAGSTPRLRMCIAYWSASCQLGFLTCSLHLLYSCRLYRRLTSAHGLL